jgi:hypothetical protein
LGAVVRGQTPHFDYVAGECARGIQQVALSESLPVIFGVLTTNNQKQALDRIGGRHGHAGVRAAEAAVEMIVLMGALGAATRRAPRVGRERGVAARGGAARSGSASGNRASHGKRR